MSDSLKALTHSDEAMRQLAVLVASQLRHLPLRDLARPAWMASNLLQTVRSATGEQHVVARLRPLYDRLLQKAAQDPRPLSDLVPAELQELIRDGVQRPLHLNEDEVFRFLNQPAAHKLLEEVLRVVLLRFGKKLSSLDEGLLGGLGGKAVKRGGRGLFGAAKGVMGAMKQEFGSAMETKVQDFVGTATDEALKTMAAWIADPAHEDTLAKLRLHLVDAALATPLQVIAQQVGDVDLEGAATQTAAALKSLANRPDALEQLTKGLDTLLEEVGEESLDRWLGTLHLDETFENTSTDFLVPHLKRLASTPEFEAWWASLH